ncbi:MAG: sulfatase [Actinomycetota bacterium]
MGRPPHRLRRAVAAVALAAAAAMSLDPPARASEPRPDIVLIVTDDQRWDSLDAMPILARELVARGTTFANAFATTPLCCPSRASILTGNLAHTTRVYRNAPPFGRYEWFDDRSTLATWLDDAGYATGYVGKYLNGYQHAALTGVVPPGWDRWVAFVRPFYTDYALTVDGMVERDLATYATDRLADEAVAFVEGAEGPLFLTFAPYAPHEPSTPAPEDAAAVVPSRTSAPTVGEEDVSDKPAWVRALPPLDAGDRAALATIRTDADRSLLAVDRAIGRILDALARAGRLDRTLVVFTSDQGLAYGEHRWTKKEAPYEEVIRVPLVIRAPEAFGAPTPATRTELVANVDLAPTIAEFAGVAHPATDGTSLAPLLRGEVVAWRDAVLLEHLGGGTPVPSYCGVRTADAKYVRYGTGEEELYDLVADPFEATNLADEPSALLDDLRSRTRTLCVPPPPGMEGGHASGAWIAIAVLALLATAPVRYSPHGSPRRPGPPAADVGSQPSCDVPPASARRARRRARPRRWRVPRRPGPPRG